MKEEHIKIPIQAPVYTLNSVNDETEYIWIVFHGYGQLSQYFINKFEGLDPEKHFIIAPQGLSKFYQSGFKGRVGASWMTKEDRITDINNQKSYWSQLASHYDIEGISKHRKLIYFGFSQGVSAMCRAAAHIQVPFESMIFWAGSIPPELDQSDFSFVDNPDLRYFSGTKDSFYKKGMEYEIDESIMMLFQKRTKIQWFDGVHEVRPEIVKTIFD